MGLLTPHKGSIYDICLSLLKYPNNMKSKTSLVKGPVIGFIYTRISILSLYICDNCSKAEYTGLMNLCTVSVPYVRHQGPMGLGYIYQIFSGLIYVVQFHWSWAFTPHPAPYTLHPANDLVLYPEMFLTTVTCMYYQCYF